MVTDIQNPFRDGRDGKDGKDGESAYEIAVRHGFAGTETEWLESLRGKDGRDGLTLPGPCGPQGVQGLNGKDAYELSGFHGTREEWLQSLKTLGLNKNQLQQELLERDIADNMSVQSKFDTDSQNVIAAVNETLATAKNGSQSAMNTITALMQSVCLLSGRVNMLEAQIKKGGC